MALLDRDRSHNGQITSIKWRPDPWMASAARSVTSRPIKASASQHGTAGSGPASASITHTERAEPTYGRSRPWPVSRTSSPQSIWVWTFTVTRSRWGSRPETDTRDCRRLAPVAPRRRAGRHSHPDRPRGSHPGSVPDPRRQGGRSRAGAASAVEVPAAPRPHLAWWDDRVDPSPRAVAVLPAVR
jgi:hypothetical protein